MLQKTVTRGARIAIIVGIIVAVGIGVAIAAVSMPKGGPAPINNENNTDGGGKNVVVELQENLSVEAK